MRATKTKRLEDTCSRVVRASGAGRLDACAIRVVVRVVCADWGVAEGVAHVKERVRAPPQLRM